MREGSTFPKEARPRLLADRVADEETIMPGRSDGTRAIALVGPGGAGKTSLAEALLFAAGSIDRQGSVDAGTSVGDASAESRSRAGSGTVSAAARRGSGAALADQPSSIPSIPVSRTRSKPSECRSQAAQSGSAE